MGPDIKQMLSRLISIVKMNRHRGVVVSTVVAGFLVVMGGIAIAAQTTANRSATQQALTQSSIVNAPAAQSQTQDTNAPLAQAPSNPLASPMTNYPLSANPMSPTPTTIPNFSARNVTTTTTQARTQTSTPSGGATPTTIATPTTTVNTVASNPRVTTTTAAPVSPTTAAFNRVFTVDAADSSSEFLPGDPRIGVDVTVTDNGGFISKVSVNWQAGDTPEQKVYDLTTCTLNTLTGRPSTAHNEHFEHTYAAGGTYNVVVAVTSTDCSGNNPRTTYQTVTVTASGSTTSAGDSPSARR